MKQFLTESMCGYLSGSVTLTSVNLMFRYCERTRGKRFNNQELKKVENAARNTDSLLYISIARLNKLEEDFNKV
jgi:hypothetical protein